MGFIDNFIPDTPVTIKHDEYYSLMREAAKAELLLNGIKAGVPNRFLAAIATGEVIETEEYNIVLDLNPLAMAEAAKEFAKNKEAEPPEVEAEEETQEERVDPDNWSCRKCTNNGNAEECVKCKDGSNYEPCREGEA